MFCVATTPTPARAWAQRAATAGDEEEMAIPIMPVSAQRAMIEKVIAAPVTAWSSGIRNDGDRIDFHQPFGPGQRRDDDAGRDRKHALQPFADNAVDRLAIARIDDVDGDLGDMVELASPPLPAAS